MKKPSAICTLATCGSLIDLKILLYSFRLFEKDVPVYVLCDSRVPEKVKRESDANVHFYPQLDAYTSKNRQQMEQEGIWTDFMLNKCDIIDIALQHEEDVLFVDSDICFMNELPLIDVEKFELGGSPHFIRKVDTDKYGYYNGGFLWIANKNVTGRWKEYTKTARFFEQSSIEDIMEEFVSFSFPIQNNFGWWRLFQCDNPQSRLQLFTLGITGYILFDRKPLRTIHTHLTLNTDINMPVFNTIIRKFLNASVKKYKNRTYARLLTYLRLLENKLV
ncbi:MAG: hypothetical protein CMB80_24680 [Flammeovirgaceae bacterium]|nr:hypothetical protein [Flammeovirgaceae bacterium]